MSPQTHPDTTAKHDLPTAAASHQEFVFTEQFEPEAATLYAPQIQPGGFQNLFYQLNLRLLNSSTMSVSLGRRR